MPSYSPPLMTYCENEQSVREMIVGWRGHTHSLDEREGARRIELHGVGIGAVDLLLAHGRGTFERDVDRNSRVHVFG